MCLDTIDINYEVLFGLISLTTGRRGLSCNTSSSPYSSPAIDAGIARQPVNWPRGRKRIDTKEVL